MQKSNLQIFPHEMSSLVLGILLKGGIVWIEFLDIGDILINFDAFGKIDLGDVDTGVKIDDGVGFIDVQEGVDKEESAFPKETLSDLFKGNSVLVSGFQKIQVFSSRELSLSFNTITLVFITLEGSGVGQDGLLVEVAATLLTSPSESILNSIILRMEESIIKSEHFDLSVARKNGDGVLAFRLLQQELAELLGDISLKTQNLEDAVISLVDFSFEASIAVVNNVVAGVTVPSILELKIKISGLFGSLVSSCVAF